MHIASRVLVKANRFRMVLNISPDLKSVKPWALNEQVSSSKSHELKLIGNNILLSKTQVN